MHGIPIYHPCNTSRHFWIRSAEHLASNLHCIRLESSAGALARTAGITNRGTLQPGEVPMTTKLYPEKSADLPPKGASNPDPITGAPGSHPIETGVGAAVGGAATGMAVGAVAGPVGTAIGCGGRCRRRRPRRQGHRRADRPDHRGQLASRSLQVAPIRRGRRRLRRFLPRVSLRGLGRVEVRRCGHRLDG